MCVILPTESLRSRHDECLAKVKMFFSTGYPFITRALIIQSIENYLDISMFYIHLKVLFFSIV